MNQHPRPLLAAAAVLAVIAAVVEVERKLYLSRPDAHQALRRPAVQS